MAVLPRTSPPPEEDDDDSPAVVLAPLPLLSLVVAVATTVFGVTVQLPLAVGSELVDPMVSGGLPLLLLLLLLWSPSVVVAVVVGWAEEEEDGSCCTCGGEEDEAAGELWAGGLVLGLATAFLGDLLMKDGTCILMMMMF